MSGDKIMVKKVLAFLTAAATIGVMFTGCSSSKPSSSTSGTQKKNISLLMCWAPNQDASKIMISLCDDYKKTNSNFTYSFEYVPQADVTQKCAVLLASNDLPDAFTYGSSRLNDLKDSSGKYAIVDVGTSFKKLGILDSINTNAQGMLKSLNKDGKMYAIPLGMNIEGMYYNKALFTKAGITSAPSTWDDLNADCDKLLAAGIQPIALGGKDKWPITRWINAYVFRSLGKDAMKSAAQGNAKFTDAGYIKAANVVADMAKKGYFGKGAVTVDNGTAETMITNSKAAIMYDGSWFTDTLNASTNAAGANGVGFFPVPLVSGGTSDASIYPMNAGTVMAFSAKKYDAQTEAWLKYIIPKFGDKGMEIYGSFKGYVVNNMPSYLPTYTSMLADEMKKAKDYTFWFEAYLDSTTNGTDGGWAQSVINGEMSGTQFMTNVQNSVTQNKSK